MRVKHEPRTIMVDKDQYNGRLSKVKLKDSVQKPDLHFLFLKLMLLIFWLRKILTTFRCKNDIDPSTQGRIWNEFSKGV